MAAVAPDKDLLLHAGTVDTDILTEVRTGGGAELDSLLKDRAVRATRVLMPSDGAQIPIHLLEYTCKHLTCMQAAGIHSYCRVMSSGEGGVIATADHKTHAQRRSARRRASAISLRTWRRRRRPATTGASWITWATQWTGEGMRGLRSASLDWSLEQHSAWLPKVQDRLDEYGSRQPQ